VNKIIKIDPTRNMTRSQEFAIKDAFERYEGEVEIKVPQRDHLGSKFRKGVSCEHKWSAISVGGDALAWLQKNFEETEITQASACTVCGATALLEDNKIWAYDATTRYFGKIPKEKFNANPQKNERKAR
jgi:hypothetical protein